MGSDPVALRPRSPSRAKVALLLAQIELVRAFRRSGLGPLWNTVGVAVVTGAVGLLFGTILRRQLDSFDAYVSALAAGVVMWAFLSRVTNESSTAFARWMPVIRHAPISFSVIAMSIIFRHLPIFILNVALLCVAQFAVLGGVPNPVTTLAAMVLLIANVSWISVVSLVLGARFRDFGQLVASAMQIVFLLTPILWPPYFLGRFEYLLLFNPFYYQLTVFDSAVAGAEASTFHWIAATVSAVVGSVAALAIYRWSCLRWRYWI